MNTATQERLGLTIVVPCFNEEESLPPLIDSIAEVEAVLAETCSVQWLFVDDGSSDGTWAILESLPQSRGNVHLVRHAQNRGICAAIRSGIDAAQTEIVASIDSDGSYDPRELARMIPLLSDDVALVTASPYHPAGEVRDVPTWRLALSRGASRLYRAVLGSKLHTFTSCFRVYRKSRVTSLPLCEDRFLGTAELIAELLRRGEIVVEHPARLKSREFGRSKLKTMQTIAGHLRLLTRLMFARRGIAKAPVTTLSQQLN
jgi:glycosyltransferase involved in cell wall biosynthesis